MSALARRLARLLLAAAVWAERIAGRCDAPILAPPLPGTAPGDGWGGIRPVHVPPPPPAYLLTPAAAPRPALRQIPPTGDRRQAGAWVTTTATTTTTPGGDR